jgi:hypothetical protein
MRMLLISLVLLMLACKSECQNNTELPVVKVWVSTNLLDVRAINDKKVQFESYFEIVYSWANPPSPSMTPIDGSTSQLKEEDVPWIPSVQFANMVRLKLPVQHDFRVSPVSNRIEWKQTIRAEFTSGFDLSQFPFDSQNIHVVVTDGRDDLAQIVFVDDPTRVEADFLSSERFFHLVGWSIDDGFEGTASDIGDDGKISTVYRWDVDMTRDWVTYVTQEIVPAIVMVMVSWSGFWIDPKVLIARVMPLLFAMTSLITLNSFTGATIVRTDNTTWLEAFSLFSLSMIFCGLLELVCVHHYEKHGFRPKAKLVDNVSRQVYPCIYVIFLVFLLLYYLVNDLGAFLWLGLSMTAATVAFLLQWHFHWGPKLKRQEAE